jgi:hypothetical protein
MNMKHVKAGFIDIVEEIKSQRLYQKHRGIA